MFAVGHLQQCCRRLSAACAVLLLAAVPSIAQQACPAPTSLAPAPGNIFTAQQEMDLGDALAEQLERDFRVVPDDTLNAYLQSLGEKLVRQMPPTSLQFRFRLVELPIVNAFTLPGGRVYVTRRLVLFARSQDELAAVLAHELGHAITHQPAADASAMFRDVLGVTAVGDRNDVFAKYHQMLENISRRPLHHRGGTEREQLIADQAAPYAMARAGYSPAAFQTFWTRFADPTGKTGSWLSELFGTTKPAEKRLRELNRYIASMPAACLGPAAPADQQAFFAWQARVLQYSNSEQAAIPGLIWKRPLHPPLESGLFALRFSPNGNYLLAQDEGSVYVLSRQPLAPLFRIDAGGAHAVRFTSDSSALLLVDSELRVQRWSIAQKQRVSIRTAELRSSCLDVALSPDGQVLACLAQDGSLLLSDLASGTTLLDKENFLPEAPRLAFLQALGINLPVATIDFSPDGRFFAAGYRGQTLLFDLSVRRPVAVARGLEDLLALRFAFTAPDRLLGVLSPHSQQWEEATFPKGRKIRTMSGGYFPFQTWSAALRGDYLVVRPFREYPVGVVDLQAGKVVLASKESALDVYGDFYARGRVDGSIAILDLKTHNQEASTSLPRHYLGRIQASAISDDLQWLAVSNRSGGSVWNLTTGGQVFHLRPFRGASFSVEDRLFADFPKFAGTDRMLGMLWPVNGQIALVQKIDNPATAQFGPFLLVQSGKEKPVRGFVQGFAAYTQGWSMHDPELEVHDVASSSLLWSSQFRGDMRGFNVSPQAQRLVLIWPLKSDQARHALNTPSLERQAEAVRDREAAFVLQVLDLRTGQPVGSVLVDTGKGSFAILAAQAAGDHVVVSDNLHRVLIYSLEGRPEQRLFGRHPVISPSGSLLSFQNEAGSLVIYDLASMKDVTELHFPESVAFCRFMPGDKHFFVLTSDQTAYLLGIPASPPAVEASATK